MDNTRRYIPKAVGLIDQVREVLRFHHYAYSTEQSYVSWILKYIRFHNKKHPKDMAKHEVEQYLSHIESRQSKHHTFFFLPLFAMPPLLSILVSLALLLRAGRLFPRCMMC